MYPFKRKLNKNIKVPNYRGLVIFLVLAFSLSAIWGSGLILGPNAADAQGPEIIILSPQNTTYTTTSIQLIFTIDKETSWIGHSLDFQENVTTAGNTTLAELSEGGHSVMVFANDTSGLMGASERIYFTVSPLHDVAVINISLPFSKLCVGETINLNVTVKDKGSVRESFNVTVRYNNTIIETKPVNNLTEGSEAILAFGWNTSAVPAGIYVIRAEVSVITGEINIDDNVLIYGTIRLYPKPLVQIRPSTIQVKMEQNFTIGVWIVNVTKLCHFEFNLYYNSSLLYVEEVFVCDEFGMFLTSPYSGGRINNDGVKGNLSVSLTQSNAAIPVNGSGEMARIKFRVVGTLLYSWKPNSTNFLQCALNLSDLKIGVRIEGTRFLEQYRSEISVYGAEYKFKPVPGDLNLDGMTDVIDLSGCGKQFGKTGESIFDLNGDQIVDKLDLGLVAVNIGRTKP